TFDLGIKSGHRAVSIASDRLRNPGLEPILLESVRSFSRILVDLLPTRVVASAANADRASGAVQRTSAVNTRDSTSGLRHCRADCRATSQGPRSTWKGARSGLFGTAFLNREPKFDSWRGHSRSSFQKWPIDSHFWEALPQVVSAQIRWGSRSRAV